MAIKVGINGFGRIGRLVLRRAFEIGGFDFVGINDLTDAKTLGHLLKYDSIHGKFSGEIKVDGNWLIVNGDRIEITCEKDPSKLPWGSLGTDIVIESTGHFADRAGCQKHIDAGAKKVILTVPPKGDKLDKMIVLGVNDSDLKKEDKLVKCLLHHELPCADGESAERFLWYRAGIYDDRAFLHQRSESARSST